MTFEEKQHDGKSLYVGMAIAQVRMINPTLTELVAAHYYSQKAVDAGKINPPDYSVDGNGQARLDFYLQVQPRVNGKAYDSFPIRKSFWIKNEEFANKEGNPMYMNAEGRTARKEHYDDLPPLEKQKWYAAKIGERELVEFIRQAADLKANEPTPPLDFAKLMNGDLRDLAAIFSTPRYTQELLGVSLKNADEGKYYQDHFGKVSARSWSDRFDYLHEKVKYYLENGGADKKYFGINPNEYKPEEFKLRFFVPGEEKGESKKSETPQPVAVATQEDEDDGLPF